MIDQLALDLRTDVERSREERIAVFREHMAQDWQNPGKYLQVHSTWKNGVERIRVRTRARPIPDGGWITDDGWTHAVRCGRCAEVIHPYGLVIEHDLGYGGCPRDRGRYKVAAFQYLKTRAATVRALCDREERAAFADCKACKHPWALHVYHQTMPPCLDGRGGGGGHCTACHPACRMYVPPAMAATPWGTCPGCWGEPHRGSCPA